MRGAGSWVWVKCLLLPIPCPCHSLTGILFLSVSLSPSLPSQLLALSQSREAETAMTAMAELKAVELSQTNEIFRLNNMVHELEAHQAWRVGGGGGGRGRGGGGAVTVMAVPVNGDSDSHCTWHTHTHTDCRNIDRSINRSSLCNLIVTGIEKL